MNYDKLHEEMEKVELKESAESVIASIVNKIVRGAIDPADKEVDSGYLLEQVAEEIQEGDSAHKLQSLIYKEVVAVVKAKGIKVNR